MDADIFSLAEQLGSTLKAKAQKLATAESCTGGWVAKAVTDVAGSSEWFDCGFILYTNSAKIDVLGVSESIIDTYGAVSEQTVSAMATAVLQKSCADIAISVSGIAGPGGGSLEKPVGTVWFAVARRGDLRVNATCKHFDGDRDSVRHQSVIYILGEIIRSYE